MTRQEILAGITNAIVAIRHDIDRNEISEGTTLGALELDSVTLVELSVLIEQQFGEEVDVDTWIDEGRNANDNSLTVGSLATFIESTIDKR